MFRFDLLDEYACVVAPKRSLTRGRETDHRDLDGDRQFNPRSNWRYGVTGVIVILAVAIVAF